jgi:hypothetical protein
MVRWLERNGYDVAYITDIDTHEQPAMLLRHRAFFSVGHDEYWSKQMRDNVEAALRSGVSLGFFSGNEMYWNIRLESSPLGPDRVITCYKSAILDPISSTDPSKLDSQHDSWLSSRGGQQQRLALPGGGCERWHRDSRDGGL